MKVITLIANFLLAVSVQAAVPQGFTTKLFAEKSSTTEPVVVGFHSPACGSCKIQKPNLEAILKESSFESVQGLMADFDGTSTFRKSLEKPVRNPSTIVIFRSGREIARIEGVTSKDELRSLIQNAVSIEKMQL